MGITNFCKLVDCVLPPSDAFDPFDAVLIDAQSYLYSAIHYSFSTREREFVREVCANVYRDLEKVLRSVLVHATATPTVVVVLSFDGAGVPMKWPTQRERRRAESLRAAAANRDQQPPPTPSRKRLYQMSLFGANRLSRRVQTYVLKRLTEFRMPSQLDRLRVVLCGCNVPGEGEHKLFQLAETQRLRRPVVVSVDQDVFVIALARLERFESVQIHRYGKVYKLSAEALFSSSSPYPWKRFLVASFLLGNDFAPAIVHASDTNVASIHNALHFPVEEEEEDPPRVVHAFLRRMTDDGALRYEELAFLNRELLRAFWTVFVWMEDYYRLRTFPQLHMHNDLWDRFDRNALVTGLCDLPSSREAFRAARDLYDATVAEECRDPLSQVVLDDAVREALRKLIASSSSPSASGGDGGDCRSSAADAPCCSVLTVSRS